MSSGGAEIDELKLETNDLGFNLEEELLERSLLEEDTEE
jgi:hypothetical protein